MSVVIGRVGRVKIGTWPLSATEVVAACRIGGVDVTAKGTSFADALKQLGEVIDRSVVACLAASTKQP